MMAVPLSITKIAIFAFLLFSTCTISAKAWTTEGWGTPRGRRETNGMRLSRGLPPLPPRKLYNATRVGPALARRSPIPVTNFITATKTGQSTPLCYFGSGQACQTTQTNGLQYFGQVGVAQQDLDVTSSRNSGYNLIAQDIADFHTIASGDYMVLNTADNAHTLPGAVPAASNTYEFYYESAIWTVDSQGGITGTYVNPGGSAVPLIFWVLPGTANVYVIYGATDTAVINSNSGIVVNLAFA